MAPIRLDDAIAAITRIHSEPLDQLADAMLAADHLGDVADHLVGHFVDQARRSGASWTEIGRSMGVSKQAAQKRYVPRYVDIADAAAFQRFTPRARRSVVAAHAAAQSEKVAQIEPRHLIMGLLSEPEGIAARVLEGRSVAVQAAPGTTSGDGTAADPGPMIPYGPAAAKALDLTVREALRLGHNYIGTEHILLGLIEQENGDGPLASAGATREAVESRILDLIGQSRQQPQPPR